MGKDKIEEVVALYKKYAQLNSIMGNHHKIMIALPKNKKKKHEFIISQILMKLVNARNAFNVSAGKLNPDELATVHAAVYV